MKGMAETSEGILNIYFGFKKIEMINTQANKSSSGGENKKHRLSTLSPIRERSNDTCGKVSLTGERSNYVCGEVSLVRESFKKLVAGFPLRRTVQRNSPQHLRGIGVSCEKKIIEP